MLQGHLVKCAISCTVQIPAVAVTSSRFQLNFKRINLKHTSETWNIRIAFLSVIPTRCHLIHLIIHARVQPQSTQRYTMSIVVPVWQHLVKKYMLHGSLSEHRIFSLIWYLASFLWLILYHSPPIFFFFQPVNTVTRLRTHKSWFHSREGHDFFFFLSVYSLRRNISHCNNIIFQVFTEEFERFTWKLNKHEYPFILPWTWLIAFISTSLDNGIKFLWKQGVCLECTDLATRLHSVTHHNVSYLTSLKDSATRVTSKTQFGSELKIIVHPCPHCTTKPATSGKSVTAVLTNK
jgi:hypothetical protein